MTEQRDFDYYRQILDSLEPGTIERYDREESGEQGGAFWVDGGRGSMEHEQGGGAYTFAALCRSDQAAILRTLDSFFQTKTARVYRGYGYPTSYGIKHAVERYTGFYCSNLQAKVAMRILGYERGGDDLNPNYNVSKREWRVFDDYSRTVADKRSAARQRIERQDEAQRCARYFYRLAKA